LKREEDEKELVCARGQTALIARAWGALAALSSKVAPLALLLPAALKDSQQPPKLRQRKRSHCPQKPLVAQYPLKVDAHGRRSSRKSSERLPPIKSNILTYLRHPITNAVTEGLNSKIQAIKANARGFRSFFNYRAPILFFCGKLHLHPQ
jgi:transposase